MVNPVNPPPPAGSVGGTAAPETRPNAETNEFRVYGPPGTGKTTWIGRQLPILIERYGAERILICSLTRAAAHELTGRELPLPPQNIGTLHSHCYRLLRRPVIAESKIGEWNRANPSLSIGASRSTRNLEADEEPMPAAASTGEELWDRMNLYRVQLFPPEAWDPAVRRFWQRWREWKEARKLMDFTDLLEGALRENSKAPGEPDVLIVDEAQDHAPLELAILRCWARYAEHLVIVGDPDQAIYTWRGADPRAFQSPAVPATRRLVLHQSYRVPRAPHQRAHEWIQQITDREPISYLPRADAGTYDRSRHTYRQPEALIEEAHAYTKQTGKSVMILAACAYMLEPAMRYMRLAGIPFGNPYRRKQSNWNPLRHGSAARTTAVDRVLSFLRPSAAGQSEMWNAEDLRRITELMPAAGRLVRGAKSDIAQMPADTRVTLDQLYRWFELDTADALVSSAMDGTPAILASLASPDRRRALDYPLQVYERGGMAALTEAPKITIGTIHSVKGAGAHRVYLFPDLSATQLQGWHSDAETWELIVRTFYVAMTRTIEDLIICEPATRSACLDL